MVRKGYSAGAVKLSFWFLEFKKTVELLANGTEMTEIRRQALEENLYAAPSADRAKQIFQTVSARIQSLDESFYPIFQKGDISTQKLLALTAVMVYDTLFFDFVYEVLREKMIIGSDEFSDKDIRIFFKDKQQQYEKAARWTDYTCKRLGRCYKTMLFEAGMTDKGKEIRRIKKPILEPELEQWMMEHNLEPVIKALTGVR